MVLETEVDVKDIKLSETDDTYHAIIEEKPFIYLLLTTF